MGLERSRRCSVAVSSFSRSCTRATSLPAKPNNDSPTFASRITGNTTSTSPRRKTGDDTTPYYIPTPQKERAVLPEKQDRAFGEFYKSARYNKILDQKTTLLIHLATAMAATCYP